MRIRSIKPEFWRSDDVTCLPWETRLLFIGLWSYVDDNGVGRDDERIITADLFALDGDLTESSLRVHDGLIRLQTRGLITRYSVRGKKFLHVTSWSKHQKINRPSPGRFPLPGHESAVIHDVLTEPSLNTPEPSLPGAGEQGSSGAGNREQGSSVSAAARRRPIALVEPPDDEDEPPEPDLPPPPREDIEELCNLLADLIESNGSKRPTITHAWRNDCRLMLDRDKRSVVAVRTAIHWCQADAFWKANILSMGKLREKYDQLRLQAQRDAAPGRTTRQQETTSTFDQALAWAAEQDAQKAIGS